MFRTGKISVSSQCPIVAIRVRARTPGLVSTCCYEPLVLRTGRFDPWPIATSYLWWGLHFPEVLMLYDLTVTQFSRMLQNLSQCLDKASAFADTKKITGEVLLNSRLAPDQFNLLRQIQIACDTAKAGVARLTGQEPPAHPDDEQTIADAKARIDKVVAYLQTFTAKDFAGAEEREITQPRWAGKYLLGREFAMLHMIPNLYFHVTTAYAILRHNGVEVGKKDYLGAMPFREPKQA